MSQLQVRVLTVLTMLIVLKDIYTGMSILVMAE